jgi:transketolase
VTVSKGASLGETATAIRRLVLEHSHRAGVGHIGSNLCVADILAALYGRVLDRGRDRDRFVLGKGHAGLALYAALRLAGEIEAADLESFCTDGSLFGVHPEARAPGVDFSTGSLGHGLSVAVGAALAARLERSPRRAWALLSDAECNEGSTWEAVMFASHHGLANVIAIVDCNGQQALGYTHDVLDLAPLARRFEAFGWDTVVVDGHDPDLLAATLGGLSTDSGAPHAVIATTVFGRGVSFMERRIEWHYWPMSDDQFGQALAEIGGGG